MLTRDKNWTEAIINSIEIHGVTRSNGSSCRRGLQLHDNEYLPIRTVRWCVAVVKYRERRNSWKTDATFRDGSNRFVTVLLRLLTAADAGNRGSSGR